MLALPSLSHRHIGAPVFLLQLNFCTPSTLHISRFPRSIWPKSCHLYHLPTMQRAMSSSDSSMDECVTSTYLYIPFSDTPDFVALVSKTSKPGGTISKTERHAVRSKPIKQRRLFRSLARAPTSTNQLLQLLVSDSKDSKTLLLPSALAQLLQGPSALPPAPTTSGARTQVSAACTTQTLPRCLRGAACSRMPSLRRRS
ncbi:hypothetical protein C8R46DRAFT_614992 [Mycena filopes]|nr:hypothetical protein C8R46DRAFT_614992 [Mycena filopes]